MEIEPDQGQGALNICREILGATLNWDDDFIDWGAHSIAMAKLTQALRQAGYHVSVRDLLTDFRTPRLVAQLPLSQTSDTQEAQLNLRQSAGAALKETTKQRLNQIGRASCRERV